MVISQDERNRHKRDKRDELRSDYEDCDHDTLTDTTSYITPYYPTSTTITSAGPIELYRPKYFRFSRQQMRKIERILSNKSLTKNQKDFQIEKIKKQNEIK